MSLISKGFAFRGSIVSFSSTENILATEVAFSRAKAAAAASVNLKKC